MSSVLFATLALSTDKTPRWGQEAQERSARRLSVHAVASSCANNRHLTTANYSLRLSADSLISLVGPPQCLVGLSACEQFECLFTAWGISGCEHRGRISHIPPTGSSPNNFHLVNIQLSFMMSGDRPSVGHTERQSGRSYKPVASTGGSLSVLHPPQPFCSYQQYLV